MNKYKIDNKNMKLQDILDRMEKQFEDIKQMLGMKRMPSYDLIERENEIDILIDLPGFSKKDIDVEIGEDYIKVKANKKKRDGKYIINERSYSLYRSISIPYKINVEKAKAKMENGVLEITIPIERKEGKKIKIE